ncbi:hypothetical protein [Francisella frigiditurris]|uniref:Putative membrane protein n=1 Tax=Francisella frigiditurris TaxID=1542390 RepID=A0A1J0KS71_9GAMM|nr:hypothetical protein [Francisella frigiditurris]APC96551.1 putative membrane protein [Francisella frigiditurris]
MSAEEFLSKKLQKFSLLDIALVKWVYLFIGALTCTLYTPLLNVSWIFFLLMALIAQFPLLIHFFTSEGTYMEKARHYLATNKPAYQVLLFFSTFFFGCMITVLAPVLITVPWYAYVGIIVVLAIKPMTSNMFW